MSPQNRTPDVNTRRFYGKYRAVVCGDVDPELIARIRVKVPDVLGKTDSTWAMPCLPVTGRKAGCFAVPPVGSHVWVEFEQGDPDYPVWVGGFWEKKDEVPDAATVPPPADRGQNIVLQTTGQNMIVLSDAPSTPTTGGIVLQSAGGATIVVNQTGIYISNGQGATITLIGPSVAVNDDGLVVA